MTNSQLVFLIAAILAVPWLSAITNNFTRDNDSDATDLTIMAGNIFIVVVLIILGVVFHLNAI